MNALFYCILPFDTDTGPGPDLGLIDLIVFCFCCSLRFEEENVLTHPLRWQERGPTYKYRLRIQALVGRAHRLCISGVRQHADLTIEALITNQLALCLSFSVLYFCF